jgi:hypothetical protein
MGRPTDEAIARANKLRDLAQRLRWLYGDPFAHMRTPEAMADFKAWRDLGRR